MRGRPGIADERAARSVAEGVLKEMRSQSARDIDEQIAAVEMLKRDLRIKHLGPLSDAQRAHNEATARLGLDLVLEGLRADRAALEAVRNIVVPSDGKHRSSKDR
jgi:hypothetical protein